MPGTSTLLPEIETLQPSAVGNYDNWWETPGEPSAAQQKADREAAFDAETKLELDAQQWTTEEYMFDDLVVGSVFRSVSSSNPWVYYESGIICARDFAGDLKKNSCGEKIKNLREWDRLSSPQRIALRHQNIRRDEWEKLPWTGHMCYLFARAWEIVRLKSHHKREKQFDEMRNVLDEKCLGICQVLSCRLDERCRRTISLGNQIWCPERFLA